MLDKDNNEKLVSEQEIIATFKKYPQWQGSADKMWAKIRPKVQPLPWYKKGRSWWSFAAAAVLILLLIFNQNPIPPQEPQKTDTEPEVELFTTRMSADTMLTGYEPVTITIDSPPVAEPGSTIEIIITLTAHDQRIDLTDNAVLRMLSTDNAEPMVVAEIMLESLDDKAVAAGHSLVIPALLQTPATAGVYRLDVQTQGVIDNEPVTLTADMVLNVSQNFEGE